MSTFNNSNTNNENDTVLRKLKKHLTIDTMKYDTLYR